MHKIRKQKVESTMKKEISGIIMRDIKDPRVKLVAINEVSLTNDLKTAHVYITIIGDDKERKKTLAGLKSAAGFIRKEIGERIRLRYNPGLVFSVDDKIEQRDRVLKLLKTIEEGRKND